MQGFVRGIIAVVLAALAFGGVLQATAAQFDTSELPEIDGLERAVQRLWAGDIMAAAAALGEDGDISEIELILGISGAVFAFDSVESATAGMTEIERLVVEGVSTGEGPEFSLEDTELDGLEGEQTAVKQTSVELEGMPADMLLTITQDDAFVYVVFGVAVNVDFAERMVGINNLLIEGEAGDGEEQLSPTGGSTGGLWEKFPPDDAEPLEGLTNQEDGVIYPADAVATPAA